MSRSERPSGIHRRLRVLVIDDDPAVGRSIASMMFPSDVECIGDALDALVRLTRGCRYDVVFVDVNMPGLDGVEILNTIRNRAPSMASRVVFLLEGRCNLTALSAMVQFEAGWVEKPIAPDALDAQMREVLGNDNAESFALAVGWE